MIYILLKSQDVSKLNTKGNIPVEFPKVKKGLQNVKPNFSVFFKFKKWFKGQRASRIPFKPSYCLQTDVCHCILSSLFPFLTFNHSFINFMLCNCCMYSLCSDPFFINHSLISSSDTLILFLNSW